MAHSCIEFKGETIFMHDAEIVSVIAYMLYVMNKYPEKFPKNKHAYFESWKEILSFYTPGCVGLDFSDNLDTDEQRSNFRELVDATSIELATEPDPFPGSRLNAMAGFGSGSSIKFHDRPHEKMRGDLNKLMNFVIKQEIQFPQGVI